MASLDQICLVVSEKIETGRHGITEILLKVALKHQTSKSINHKTDDNRFVT